MSEQELQALVLAQQRELECIRSEYQELYELHKYWFEWEPNDSNIQCWSSSVDTIDDFFQFDPDRSVQTVRWDHGMVASFREDGKDRVCNFFGSLSIECTGKRAVWGFGADCANLTVLTRHLDEMLSSFAEAYTQAVCADTSMGSEERQNLLAKLADFCGRVRGEIERESK